MTGLRRVHPQMGIARLFTSLTTSTGVETVLPRVIGAYKQCAFYNSGVGSWFATDSTNPAVGEKNKLETVGNCRLEMNCGKRQLADLDRVIRSVHPYEEPAWEAYPLADIPSSTTGSGEMSHHEVLDALSKGTSVILCEHTNTERGYLPILKAKIEEKVQGKIEVAIASTDADPLVVF